MAWPACDGLAAIMRDKGRKCWIEDRLACLPPKDDRLFIVVQAFPRNALVIVKGVLVPADEAKEVMAGREVDVVPAGEAEDVGEALDGARARPGLDGRIKVYQKGLSKSVPPWR